MDYRVAGHHGASMHSRDFQHCHPLTQHTHAAPSGQEQPSRLPHCAHPALPVSQICGFKTIKERHRPLRTGIVETFIVYACRAQSLTHTALTLQDHGNEIASSSQPTQPTRSPCCLTQRLSAFWTCSFHYPHLRAQQVHPPRSDPRLGQRGIRLMRHTRINDVL